MACNSSPEPSAGPAAALTAALDAVEACLGAAESGEDFDALAAALAGPVRALDAAAKEAMA